MKLLAFETSTEACSVALWIDGEVRQHHEIAPRRHAELALPWAESLLAEAGIAKSQLDLIAVGRGPGAFTGVRLGVALAQGIALALDLAVVPVSTLAALAMRAWTLVPAHADDNADDARHVLAAIDARMGEIYLGAFEIRADSALALSDETVIAPSAASLPASLATSREHRWYGVGTGFAAAESVLQQRMKPQLHAADRGALPHAADVARLALQAHARGEAVAPERLEPAYLRNHVALTLAEQQAARKT